MKKKVVTVLTTSRADYGIMKDLIRTLDQDQSIKLNLIVTGSHLLKDMGLSVSEIISDGINKITKIKTPMDDDSPKGISRAYSTLVNELSKVFDMDKPDLFILLGDRYESLAAATTATNFNIKILHISGGSLSLGSTDDTYRHMITKSAHIHIVETKEYRDRVIQMGEDPKSVHNTGSLSLSKGFKKGLLSKSQLEKELKIELFDTFLISTYNPVSRELEKQFEYFKTFYKAIDRLNIQTLITFSNADVGNIKFNNYIKSITKNSKKLHLYSNLGRLKYFSLMQYASTMVGNSSSGIIESASFRLPTVNVGKRQAGRVHPENIINVDDGNLDKIIKAVNKALSSSFKNSINNISNPYQKNHALDKTYQIIKKELDKESLVEKSFNDLAQ
jgi:GDP/UDP-N,N'-diacetylbacillosamine 2-epimerase (hydrolysing)|tara:strand:- start:8224 stop:9390 length:1167 start_codon:yes stop_codon:yes gene_type:complete